MYIESALNGLEDAGVIAKPRRARHTNRPSSSSITRHLAPVRVGKTSDCIWQAAAGRLIFERVLDREWERFEEPAVGDAA
jgi:hypothetical protein